MADTYKDIVEGLNEAGARKIVLNYPKNSSALIRRIQSEFKNGHLSLILGSGVSSDSGLPDWDTITKRLIRKIFETSEGRQIVSHIQSLELSEPRKIRFLEENSPAFALAVRDALYAKSKSAKRNETLIAIAKLAKRAEKSRRSLNILTYNVDDLLETHFDLEGMSSRYSVISCEATYRAVRRRVCIYHPHGFLPRDGNMDDLMKSKLVFSERQYHDSYFDHTNWPNVIQREAFERTTCIFIGCSLDDQNQRRLLDQTNSSETLRARHIAILRKTTKFRSERKGRILDFIRTRDLDSLGIDPYWVHSWSEIPHILSKL